MRAPRYKFPDEVRSTTRSMALRMVQDGSIAESPEQLDTWISQQPEVQQILRRGGYGSAFTSHDLFPLFQVFVEQAGGPAPRAEAPAPSPKSRWPVGLIATALLVLLAIAVAIGVLL